MREEQHEWVDGEVNSTSMAAQSLSSNGSTENDERQLLYRAFSHPGAGPTMDVERFVFSWHARRECQRALRRVEGSSIAAALPGVPAVLSEWTDDARHSHWHPAVGTLWRANLDGDDVALVRSLVRASVAATLAGAHGEWSFTLDSPIALRVGSWLIRSVVGGGVRPTEGGTHFTLRTPDDSLLEFHAAIANGRLEVSGLQAGNASVELPLFDAGAGRSIALVPALLADETIIPNYADVTFTNDAGFATTNIALEDALSLLTKGAPRAFEWVMMVIREVVPLDAPPDQLSSSSSPWQCGLIAVTADPRAIPIAEMLVHEASHQHFFIAKHLGLIDDGSDTNEYYSPMVHSHRPIEKMLLAFHALGNMMAMYVDFLERDIPEQAYCRQKLQGILDKLASIETIFETSTALTPLGRGIYEPLKQQVSEVRRAFA